MNFKMNLLVIMVGLGLSGCAGRGGTGSCYVIQAGSPTIGADIGIGDPSFGSGAQILAQSFQIATPTIITGVEIPLYKVGTITDPEVQTVNLRIETNPSGQNQPSGILAGTHAEGELAISQIGTDYNFYKFTFTGGMTLQPGTYWIRVSGTYTSSATNHVKWVAHDGAGGYGDGHAAYFNNTSWITSGFGLRDFLFNLDC